ncbi:MAG: HAD-IIIC family phosphatase, partial [bacterium]
QKNADTATAPVAAISATFTAEPVEDTLAFWFEELGLECRVEFAPYNQVFQQLLDPASLLATNANGVNILLIRFDDWANSGGEMRLEEAAQQFVTGLRAAVARWRSPVIVALCPCSPAFTAVAGRAAAAERVRQMLASAVSELTSVHMITPEELAALYPVAEFHDPHGDELGRVPYTPAFFAALGTMVARKIDALRRPPHKVIVLDADYTLWKGVCAEDGPRGIIVDDDRRELQEFMLRQRDSGMLLALASKNEDDDVVETFRANPEMPLRLEHFVARRVNWQPKSANLVSLSEELGLALDSFIFVDDNETEVAEVQAHCPDVLALTVPKENAGRFLNHVWAFDHLKITQEDRERSAMYAQNLERSRLEKQTPSLADFLTALRLEITIRPPQDSELARVAQLTQRTNQMNFSTVRRSELDIRDLLRSGAAECLTVHLSDRFGSYGLVGAMLFAARGGALAVDTFLLSCRALGKGVEHRMLARLGQIAGERGLESVEARFVQSARNKPAYNFLRAVEPREEKPFEGGVLFVFPAKSIQDLSYKPAGPAKAAPRADDKAAARSAAPRRDVDYHRIATELWRPDVILERVRERREAAAPHRKANGAPRTDLERELVALWAELLAVPSVGIHDNFFDLGGHSLLAVQLMSRVRQAYNVDLSLELVYSGAFTVEALARAIELAQIKEAGADHYKDLIAEIESLSDEEVQALLAREQDASGN